MSKQVQRRRGTTTEHATFTGVAGEITVDTTKNTVVVHDGATAGGTPLAKESHNHDGVYEPVLSKSTGYARWTGSAWEWMNETYALSTHNHDGTYAAAGHTHTGTYEPSDATILKSAAIGVTVQGYDANTAKLNVANSWSAMQTFSAALIETPAVANTGTAYTVTDRSLHDLTLTGNCTFTFPTNTAGKQFTLLLKQDGTGSRTITWPSAVRWAGGTAPTITATAAKTDVISFIADGTYWLGFVGGQNYTRA